jgi:chemosensory pili system protein ChpA (sensor histidine kinase/response regulator)
MVGATELAALCWAVEQLLNRVLEGDLAWSDAAGVLVADARARLPERVEAFAAGAIPGPSPEDELLIERAQHLIAGGSAPEAAPAATAAPQQETLAEDFREEALAQLEILEHFLAAQRDAAPGPRPESVARAIHTLVGCCERLHHQPLSRALRTLEALVTRYAERGDIPGPEGLEAVAGVLGGCRDLVAGKATQVDLDAYNLRLESVRDSLLRSGPHAREPMQALMAESLEALLAAPEWLPATTAGQWRERLPALLGELDRLAAAAAESGLVPLADAAGLLAASGARALAADPAAATDRADFSRGIEQLLAMLDAVAASLPPPALDIELEARLRRSWQPERAPVVATQAAEENEPESAAEPAEPTPEPSPETAGTLPGRTPEEAPDAELVAIFLEEAAELTEQIEQSITHWRDGDAPEERAENLKRVLHTLKGSARMAGCSALGSLCHDFETLVLATAPRAADAPFFATCLGFYDRIEQQREQIARGDRQAAPQTEPAPTPLRVEPPPPAAESRPTAPPSALPAETLFRSSGVTPPWRRAVRESGAERDPTGAGQPREVVKIGASILDKLVNLADETSISRSRIEQQLQQFHFQLEEMETTVERFHDQVRRLGMETEAQIQFRREQLVSEGAEDQFDPLEMDRYSTLQQLSRALEESASDLHDLQDTLLTKARETEALLIQQARINRELQENLSLTRMVPFARIVPRLRRIVRQTAGELGKPVELELHNIEGEMDRSVLERIVPSLEHLIRNAIDHGIEAPERRSAAGKPETGRVSITFSREAGDVVIQLADDGRGLDLGAIRSKAESLGLLDPDAAIGEQDLTQLIFHPGFSTSSAVSQISGRGIGMDVVDSELRQLGGSVTPRSREGEGTEFTLRLPFTVSVNRALLMKAGRERYGTLVNNVSGVVRLDAAELEQLHAQAETGFAYRGERFKVCRLGDLIGSTEPGAELAPGKSALVLTKGTSEPTAVLVDALEPSQEVVVKSLGPQFAKVRGLSGATVLGDGQVVPILDLNALITDRVAPWSPMRDSAIPALPEPLTEASGPTVLVVDDSVTMRKATGRLLERQGYKVLSARDGVEAMQLLQELTPDLMLLDVEMPRMDGFEVTRQVRASERLRALPIVMITSRSGDKHRNKALELGVDHYLGKPYQEEHLLAVIETCLPPTGVSQRESGHGL